MSIKEFLKRVFLRRKEDVKMLAEQRTKRVAEEILEKQKEEEEETDVQIKAKIAYEHYREGLRQVPEYQQEEFVREFTRLLGKKEEISQEVIFEYIFKASQKENIDKIVPAIEELADHQVERIIFRDSNLSLEDRREIAQKGINDAELKDKTVEKLKEEGQIRQEKEVKRKLRTTYATCDKMSGQRLINDLQRIGQETKTPEIKNMITQILARRAAIDCKLLGTTRINGMTTILSAKEMLSGNFLNLIEEEFKTVQDNEDYKGEKSDFHKIKETLVEQISAEIEKEEQR